MRIESLPAIPVALALVACSPMYAPIAPIFDAAGDAWRPDTGPPVFNDAAIRDTGVWMDAAIVDSSVDAPGMDVGDDDAGPPTAITVDGLFTDAYWSGTAASLTNTVTVASPFDGDSLMVLHYGRDDEWFYMGFEGSLATGDAVVVYVDTHFGDGVQLSTGLSDTRNTINSVLSLQILASAEFQPEYGWGTSAMPHVLATGDGTIGWRTLAASPSTFTNLTTHTSSACSATGCETAMLLAQIGVPPGGLLNLVVRVGRPGVGFSNQTFPMSDTSTPETIDIPVSVPVP